jgi:hypothetical protein
VHKCILYGQNWISIVAVNMSQFLDLHVPTISLFCDKLHPQAAISWVIRTFNHYCTDEASVTTVLITVSLLTTQGIHHVGRSRAESCAWTGWTIYRPPLLMPLSQSKHLMYTQSYDIPSYLTIIINLLMDFDEYLIAWRLGRCFIKRKKIKSTPDKFYR